MIERIAGWSARHKKTAVFGWLGLVVAAVLLGGLLPSGNLSNYDPGESGRAQRAIDRLHADTAPNESVLIHAGPDLRNATAAVVAALRTTARNVHTTDGRDAVLVSFDIADPDHERASLKPAREAVAAVAARYPSARIEEAGSASVGAAVDEAMGRDFHRAELSAIPIALVLLLLVFGALIAAGIPLLLALTAVAAAMGLMSIPGQWLPVGSSAASIVLLIGLAVGVDYSLFYLRREREERAAGRSVGEALRIASATSGRAIVVSGLTVMISLAGLFLTGIDQFPAVAVGTMTVVGLAVLGSLTFLPGLLSWLGRWADRGRIPFLRTSSGSRLWGALVRRVVRRPLLWGGAAALALIALALPATGMRTGDPGLHELPAGLPIVKSLQHIEQAFPGGPSPADVVVTGPRLDRPEVAAAVTELRRRAARSGGQVREPIQARMYAGGRLMIVSVPLSDAAPVRALTTLRTDLLPASLGHVGGLRYDVTGQVAGRHDFGARLDQRAPLVFGFVLILAFGVLVYAFRSLVIPVTAILLNLLSVGAAYGLLRLVFQDGRLEGVLDFQSYGAVVSWLPLFMFVILFGLSMDYHVFILSRIRELRTRMSTREAIVEGVRSSAGVVTSAAAIMVAVFAVFATLSVVTFKMMGVGMAAAVLIDATLVRGVLLPAAMALLGEANWYFPGRGKVSPAAATRPETGLPTR